MKERDIERHLVKRVRQIGGECLKFTSPGWAGVPDRIVLLPSGELVWVELKTWLGKLSAVQIRTHKRMKELGQEVVVLRAVDQINKYFPLES